MARLKEIKEKYSNWDISIIDILSELDTTGTNKYTELFLKSMQNEHNYFYENEINIEPNWYWGKLNEWFDLELNSENNINDSTTTKNSNNSTQPKTKSYNSTLNLSN
jgi:hypothetical protein